MPVQPLSVIVQPKHLVIDLLFPGKAETLNRSVPERTKVFLYFQLDARYFQPANVYVYLEIKLLCVDETLIASWLPPYNMANFYSDNNIQLVISTNISVQKINAATVMKKLGCLV